MPSILFMRSTKKPKNYFLATAERAKEKRQFEQQQQQKNSFNMVHFSSVFTLIPSIYVIPESMNKKKTF